MGIETFSYNPLTGRLHHKEDGHLKRRGWFADLTISSDGYRQVRVGRKMMKAHRVAWEIVNGPIEDKLVIDHINGDRADNRISNLRLVDKTRNSHNRHSVVGYMWCESHQSFRVNIRRFGKTKFVGYFKTALDARAAYLNAAREYEVSL